MLIRKKHDNYQKIRKTRKKQKLEKLIRKSVNMTGRNDGEVQNNVNRWQFE